MFVPVTPGCTYKVTAGSASALFAVVKDKTITNGRQIPYATGYNGRLNPSAGTSMHVTIPSDGHYLCVATVLGSGDVRPELKKVYYIDGVAEDCQYEESVGVNDGIALARFIDGSNLWNANYKSVVYPLDGVSSITVKTNTTNATNYAFLTSYENDSVHYSDCCEIRATFLADTTSVVSVPEGAKYFYLLIGNNGGNTPSEIKFKKWSRTLATNRELNKMVGAADWGDYTEIDIFNAGTQYTNMFVGGSIGTEKWAPINGKVIRLMAVPEGAKFMRVEGGADNGAQMFILRSTKAPVANQKAEVSSCYTDRISVLPNTSIVFPLQADCKAIAWSTTPINCPKSISFATKPTSSVDMEKEWNTEYFMANSIDTPAFNDTPIDCISTIDEDATQYDNTMIGNVFVLKISDTMFYMYYVCYGAGEPIGDEYLHLAMAYSTDGKNWTRGIPEGIEAPYPGTNILMMRDCIGECVVRVQDEEYPYRMIGQKWHTSATLYKSADAVHWEAVKTWPYYFDNQVSIIVRGNMLKVYMRMRNGTNREDRYLGIVYMDIWGNLIVPPTIYFGRYQYWAAASAIDDHREIMFPTYYNASDTTAYLTCFVVDGLKVYPKDVDFSNICPNDGKWVEASNIVNINNEWYLYYGVSTYLHDDDPRTGYKVYKCAKITWNRVGWWWYPQN